MRHSPFPEAFSSPPFASDPYRIRRLPFLRPCERPFRGEPGGLDSPMSSNCWASLSRNFEQKATYDPIANSS